MRDELRERFFTPFVLPVTIIGLMLLIGLSLSRILLAVSELGASFVALLAAGYVMAMAFLIESRKRIPARALGVSLAVGLIGLVAAGTVAAAAGMRPLHEEEAGGGEVAGEAGGEVANEPVFVAIDIDYESAPETLPPGETELVLENNGAIIHNVVFEESGEKVLEAEGGETDQATVTLEAGEISYFCDIAGHREAGMEGSLTVSEDAASGTGGEASSEAGETAPEAGSEPADGASES